VSHLVRQLIAARRGLVYCRRGLRVPRAVSLTFDDGPSEWTEPILDVLAEGDARATFFVLGCSIAGREHILRRAVEQGNELGNHAFSHLDPATLPDEQLRAELARTTALVQEAAGVRTRLFRPPYADAEVRFARVARSVGLAPTVLRSIDPADWREPDAEAITRHVLGVVAAGAIVCLHDGVSPAERDRAASRQPTVEALRQLVPELTSRGYALVTVSELLA
jgi:peptidoglycan/xylan/chitin deacetylase (PgdA/CDA1 family)